MAFCRRWIGSRSSLLTTVLFIIFSSARAHDNKKYNDNPIVNTPSGRLKGSLLYSWTNKRIYSFRGVPFAEPPVGNLRFKVEYSHEIIVKNNLHVEVF